MSVQNCLIRRNRGRRGRSNGGSRIGTGVSAPKTDKNVGSIILYNNQLTSTKMHSCSFDKQTNLKALQGPCKQYILEINQKPSIIFHSYAIKNSRSQTSSWPKSQFWWQLPIFIVLSGRWQLWYFPLTLRIMKKNQLIWRVKMKLQLCKEQLLFQ